MAYEYIEVRGTVANINQKAKEGWRVVTATIVKPNLSLGPVTVALMERKARKAK